MPATPTVELHVVSDATGETAARLVQALEAQFPDQEFVEIRHPRVESEEDLQLAVNRMRGRAAVVVYTLVQPELRETMRSQLIDRLMNGGLSKTLAANGDRVITTHAFSGQLLADSASPSTRSRAWAESSCGTSTHK